MTKQEMVVTILQGLLAGDGTIHPGYARLELVQVAVEYANVILDETESRSGLKEIIDAAIREERKLIEKMLKKEADCWPRVAYEGYKLQDVSNIVLRYAEQIREGKY